jgi:hypothetical protein
MNHDSFSGPVRHASARRSGRAAAGLSVASALVAIFAASTASAQQSPALGYTLGSWPPATRFGGDTVESTESTAPPPPAPDAVAKAPGNARQASFDIGAATEVPLMVGGQATLELPLGFLLQGEVGVMPTGFVNGIDSVLTGAGVYDASTSTLVRNTLKTSLVVRGSAGIRPFTNHGFEIMGGYTLASLTGEMGARQIVESMSGAALPPQVPDAQIQLKTTIHSVHVALGWRWLIGDHVVVRASVAYLQSVGSSSSLSIPSTLTAVPGVAAQVAQVNQTVDTTLNDTLTKYLKIPVLGLSLGYRF